MLCSMLQNNQALLRPPLRQTQSLLPHHPPLAHHRSRRHRRRTLSSSRCSHYPHPRRTLSDRTPSRTPRPPTRPSHSILSHSKRRRGGAGFASLRTIAPGAYLASFIDTLHSSSPCRPRNYSNLRIRPHLFLLQLLPRPQRSRRTL